MLKPIVLLFFFIFTSCINNYQYARFHDVDLTDVDYLANIKNDTGITVLLDKVEDQIKISELIKDVKYIPLETSDNSLISHISAVDIYKDRIYIVDNIMQNKVYIFDIDGKFIKAIGQKGGGPEEYALLTGMTIDRKNERLIVYDNMKRRFMYYTLNGDFCRSVPTPFSFAGEMMVSPKGDLMSVSNKSNMNTHLKELDDYRILFTDSLGNVVKGAFNYDDNSSLAIAYSQLYRTNSELVFYPQYMNSLYTVNDSTITLRYKIDLSNYSPYNLLDIQNVKSENVFNEITRGSTYLQPNMIETNDFLYFLVTNKTEYIFSFFDKKTNNIISFHGFDYDGDCVFNPTITRMNSYQDYFVSSVPVEFLKMIKSNRDKSENKFSDNVASMIDSLHEDDNNVLVLFKLNKL